MRIAYTYPLIAAFMTLGACGSTMRTEADPLHETGTTTWDSGAIDKEYRRLRSDMDERHTREIEHPAQDESADQRGQRHQRENVALKERYDRGLKAHSQTLPPEVP